MKDLPRKALMACAKDWRSPFPGGSHLIARSLARAGWQVAFVSDPISPAHLLTGLSRELRGRFDLYRTGGTTDASGHIWAYVPGTLLSPYNKPILRSEWVTRHWQQLTFPNVVSALKRRGFGHVDLLYFDDVHQPFWLDAVHHKRAVYRMADNQSGYQKYSAAMERSERELVSRVDLVLYTALKLRERAATMSPQNMVHFPNGVEFARFAEGPAELPPEYAAIPKPIVVYVGEMEVRFDFELLTRTARALPRFSFVLIGPDAVARSRIPKLPNVFLLGRKAYGDLSRYLKNADVGIIPFDVKRYPELIGSVNPLKLYQYMACGLPVVSVSWQELAASQSPAILCEDAEQFIQGIAHAYERPREKAAYLEFARKNDWQGRIQSLIDRLD